MQDNTDYVQFELTETILGCHHSDHHAACDHAYPCNFAALNNFSMTQ